MHGAETAAGGAASNSRTGVHPGRNDHRGRVGPDCHGGGFDRRRRGPEEHQHRRGPERRRKRRAIHFDAIGVAVQSGGIGSVVAVDSSGSQLWVYAPNGVPTGNAMDRCHRASCGRYERHAGNDHGRGWHRPSPRGQPRFRAWANGIVRTCSRSFGLLGAGRHRLDGPGGDERQLDQPAVGQPGVPHRDRGAGPRHAERGRNRPPTSRTRTATRRDAARMQSRLKDTPLHAEVETPRSDGFGPALVRHGGLRRPRARAGPLLDNETQAGGFAGPDLSWDDRSGPGETHASQ